MNIQPNILIFAGSAREQSFNKKLARQAALYAEEAGAKAVLIDLRDLPLPIMDQDFEEREGEPENATALKGHLKACDGFIIASPEYNGFFPALVKNALDWASRKREGEKSMECFAGKTAAIMSASPGGLGGLRGLVHLRIQLTNLDVHVIPGQHALGGAFEAFGEDGFLSREADQKAVRRVVDNLVAFTNKVMG